MQKNPKNYFIVVVVFIIIISVLYVLCFPYIPPNAKLDILIV